MKRDKDNKEPKQILDDIETKNKEAIGTAVGVAGQLDNRRLSFAYWMCALSGILITLGGPTLLKIIHDADNDSRLLIWVLLGVCTTGLALLLGVLSCALFYAATASNPYYYFMWGRGKGTLDELSPEQKEDAVRSKHECHSHSLTLSRWFLLLQTIFFVGSILIVLITTLCFFWSYLP